MFAILTLIYVQVQFLVWVFGPKSIHSTAVFPSVLWGQVSEDHHEECSSGVVIERESPIIHPLIFKMSLYLILAWYWICCCALTEVFLVLSILMFIFTLNNNSSPSVAFHFKCEHTTCQSNKIYLMLTEDLQKPIKLTYKSQILYMCHCSWIPHNVLQCWCLHCFTWNLISNIRKI